VELSRRECVRVGLIGAAAAGLAGCAPIARRLADHPADLPLPTGPIEPEVRLLNRAGFGPRPGDVARIQTQGWNAYVHQELAASKPESISLLMQLQRQDVGQIEDPDLEDLPQAEVVRQLQQNAILRAVYGENQLKERMVDLWTNHFNVYARKGDSAFRKGAEERDVIRKFALGSFRDLLDASARNAAMLAFLDNPQNFKLHPNENYARELMELHTLGVGGGYTQRDVQEVARCFTGWTLETRFLHAKGHLRFDPDRHDEGAKVVLGHLIPANGGPADVDQVLSILASHPSTHRFIAKKLVVYFFGEENPRLIDRLAKIYAQTNGNIPSMVEPLLDPKLMAEAPPKIKRPFDVIVSAIRSTGGDTDGNNGVQEHLAAMGEPLYQWPMPDGYPSKVGAWAGTMLPRWNFAYAFAHGQIRGTLAGKPKAMMDATLGRAGVDRARIEKLAPEQDAKTLALCLASPDFQWC
jgi:uncharacterized protein (DUF1800 family)